MEYIGDLGRVGEGGGRETATVEVEAGGSFVGKGEHGKVGGEPGEVGPTIATVHLPSLLGCDFDVHVWCQREREGRKERAKRWCRGENARDKTEKQRDGGRDI